MKNLFISLIAATICSAMTFSVHGQTNVNLEKINQKPVDRYSLKFIDNIELVPGTGRAAVEIENDKTSTIAVVTEKEESPSSAQIIENCESWQFKYAMMLDMEVEKLTNRKLYSFIDSWWATRYRYGGTSRSGIDCSAFTGNLVSEVYGIALPRTAKDQYGICEKIFRDDLQEGDLVFFNTRGGISHVGVYLGNNYFVHSSVHDGVTISSLNDTYYNSKFITGGRVTNTVLPPTVTVEEEK